MNFSKSEVFPKEYFGSLVTLLEDKIAGELTSGGDDATSVVSSSNRSRSSASSRRHAVRRTRSDNALFQAFKSAQGRPKQV